MHKTTVLFTTIVLVGAAQAGAEEKKATFTVSGMSCNVCERAVERAAKRIDGVKAAKADQPKGTAEITFDPAKISVEELAKRLTKDTGFKTEPAKPKKF